MEPSSAALASRHSPAKPNQKGGSSRRAVRHHTTTSGHPLPFLSTPPLYVGRHRVVLARVQVAVWRGLWDGTRGQR